MDTETSPNKDPRQILLDSMEFLEQYADTVVDYTSRYSNSQSISYCPENVTGKPSKYPQYGDFPSTYMLRSYGNWWKESESTQPNYMPQDCEEIVAEDYMILKFEFPVVPSKIIIYETYNPGGIVRLYGRLTGDEWYLLYETFPQCPNEIPQNTARLFAPQLRAIKQTINEVRIEFNQSLLPYFTALDAVLLAGHRPLSKLQYYLLTSGLENTPGPAYKKKSTEQISPMLESSQQTTKHTVDYFEILPYETLVHIFQYLDLKSLLRCALVSKRFLQVSLDPTIYQAISLKKYWMHVDNKTLKFIQRRCKMLKKLDLSWCGNNYAITEDFFQELLRNCRTHLTHLSVCNCLFIRNVSVGSISKCRELVDLRLRNCSPSKWTFTFLADLNKLEALDICGTLISTESLIKVLKANRNLKHLIIDYCEQLTQVDDVMETLSIYNMNLLTLSCWKVRTLSANGVKCLTRCTKLRELDMGWCLVLEEPANCLEKIAQGCKDLKRLIISNWRGLNDHELLPIIYSCKQLTQVDLLGIRNITSECVAYALASLPNLRLLELTFCEKITLDEVAQWREMYPGVTILAQAYPIYDYLY